MVLIISEVTYSAEKRMALESLRSEFSSNQKSAVDRVATLEEEVCTNHPKLQSHSNFRTAMNLKICIVN